jgi:hypothetical protein
MNKCDNALKLQHISEIILEIVDRQLYKHHILRDIDVNVFVRNVGNS